MAGRPPSDARWHFTHGAPGSREGRAVYIQRINSEEDLQGVSARPQPVCSGHPDGVTGQTHSFICKSSMCILNSGVITIL